MKKFMIVSAILMIGCSDSSNLGHGYRIDRNGRHGLQIVNSHNTVLVSRHILDFEFDSSFIILSQRPWESVPGMETMKYDDYWKEFEKSTFRYYWIINKKEHNEYSLDTISRRAQYSNVYGPFTREEYVDMRERLGVPKDLQLKDEPS